MPVDYSLAKVQRISVKMATLILDNFGKRCYNFVQRLEIQSMGGALYLFCFKGAVLLYTQNIIETLERMPIIAATEPKTFEEG